MAEVALLTPNQVVLFSRVRALIIWKSFTKKRNKCVVKLQNIPTNTIRKILGNSGFHIKFEDIWFYE